MESEHRRIKLPKSIHTLLETNPIILKMEVEEHEFIEEADVEEIRKAHVTLSGGKPFCVLLDTSKGYFNVTPQANKMLASKKFTEKRMAAALVVKSLASRLAGNFFLRLKPGSPTRLFLTERDALNWLRTFRKE